MLRFGKKFLLLWSVVAIFASGTVFAGPRILMIYGSVGMGHEAAANGAAADILKKHPDAEIIIKDLRDFMDPGMREQGNKIYDIFTQKFPEVYDAIFRDYSDTGARVKSIGDMPLTDQFKPKRVLPWIMDVEWPNKSHSAPDVILSTFPSATEVLVRLRDEGNLKDIPIGWVHTDLVDETYFARMALQVDMAFVATPRLAESWIKRGIPADRVIASGMPLNPEVLKAPNPEVVANFRIEKGITKAKKTVLILGGSNGVGDYRRMVASILSQFPGEPLQIAAVCGRSKKNFQALTKMKAELAARGVDLFIEKLVKQPVLFNYMDVADVIISKTGGLTPMELFYKRKPLVLLDINGGQERYNADDFARTGLAKITRNQDDVGPEVKKLLTDKKLAEAQIAKQIEFSRTNQPGKIGDWLLSKPVAKPDIHELVYLDTSPDYPRPQGLFWKCNRLFKRAELWPVRR